MEELKGVHDFKYILTAMDRTTRRPEEPESQPKGYEGGNNGTGFCRGLDHAFMEC